MVIRARKPQGPPTFRTGGITPEPEPVWQTPTAADEAPKKRLSVALLVMNPRRIERCVESIRALPVDKFWLRGAYERQLVPMIAGLIERTRYGAYFIVSDDVCASVEAWRLLEEAIRRYPAVTGWCHLSQGVPIANVAVAPLDRDTPVLSAYHCPSADAVLAGPPVFRTWWMGFAVSGMRRDLWLRYPFGVYPLCRTANAGQPYPWDHDPARDGDTWDGGQASDYHVSRRLQADGVPVWCLRDAYVEHVKNDGAPAPLLIGQAPPEVVFERA